MGAECWVVLGLSIKNMFVLNKMSSIEYQKMLYIKLAKVKVYTFSETFLQSYMLVFFNHLPCKTTFVLTV